MTLFFRWFGVAGLEFTAEGYTLLIDPFFTRPGVFKILRGALVQPAETIVHQHINSADAILISHPHHDHLLDTPVVHRQTGAVCLGSPNTHDLLAVQGIQDTHNQVIRVGDQFSLGPFHIEVYPARHTWVPFFSEMNLRPSARVLSALKRGQTIPLRLSDYRMDTCYSFLIRYRDMRLLVGNAPVAADGLFIAPYIQGNILDTILRGVQPRWVVPIHWDNFMLPLDRPLQPILLTRMQGLPGKWQLVGKMDLAWFAEFARSVVPGVKTLRPELFKKYEAEAS